MRQDTGILWLKLNDASKARLREACPPKYENSFYDHVTLLFSTSKSEVADLIGCTAVVTAYAYADNGRVEALRVDTNGLPDTYGVPHVTVSTAHDIKPFASVAMLQGDHLERTLPERIVIEGVFEFVSLQ